MLDIEVISGPSGSALDIVSIAEMGRHIRLSATAIATSHWTGLLTDAITDAVDKLDGIGGELNRTILRRTYKRYMSTFPSAYQATIPLPFPPLIRVIGVHIEDGNSPETEVDAADYVIRTGTLVGEIEARTYWPSVEREARAVSITYECGYTVVPPKLKRMVKILAGHYVENAEATILEQNKTLIDRKVLFAMDDLRASLKVPNSYDDWAE